MIITFCGHSNYSSCLEDEERLLYLFNKISQGNKVEFYLGGYGNFDSFALKCARKYCARKYKEKHPNTKLVFITPYLGKWLNERKDFIEKNTTKLFTLKLNQFLKSLP